MALDLQPSKMLAYRGKGLIPTGTHALGGEGGNMPNLQLEILHFFLICEFMFKALQKFSFALIHLSITCALAHIHIV